MRHAPPGTPAGRRAATRAASVLQMCHAKCYKCVTHPWEHQQVDGQRPERHQCYKCVTLSVTNTSRTAGNTSR
eukprot:5023901-Pyramimonas_sp.AAC.1